MKKEKRLDQRCSGRLLRSFYLRLAQRITNINTQARPNTLETESIKRQVRTLTVPPREGAGRLGTSTSECTLHRIRSLQILFP